MRSGPLALALLSAALWGCATVPRQPPGAPPTPETVTREEPGGDAHDPHLAALQRLIEQPWGYREDRQNTLRVPMPDSPNWRRVRFYSVPTFAAFRYGDAHHAVIGVWVQEVEEGQPDDLASCLARFEAWGEPRARTFRVKLEPATTSHVRFGKSDIVVRSLSARIDTWLKRSSYSAAYAAYPLWPRVCTVVGIAVASGKSEETAKLVRDRYVKEGFAKLVRASSKLPKL